MIINGVICTDVLSDYALTHNRAQMLIKQYNVWISNIGTIIIT